MKRLLSIALLALFIVPGTLAANGCFQSDPVCGSTPTDNCDVRGNLTLNPGIHALPNGIDICADSVTLDCNSSTIAGSGKATGIDARNRNAITIRNCNVQNFAIDFLVQNTTDSAFTSNAGLLSLTTSRQNIIMFHTGVIRLSQSDTNLLDNNTGSVYLTSAHSNTLTRNGNFLSLWTSDSNTLSANTPICISLTGSRDNVIAGNVISSQGCIAGILLQSYLNNTSDNNTILNNTLTVPWTVTGIRMVGSHSNTMQNNTITGGWTGLDIAFAANTTIIKNTIVNNSEGIRIRTNASGTITNNTVCGNTNSDIVYPVFGAAFSGERNMCDTPGSWNDKWVQGCTFYCGQQEPTILSAPVAKASIGKLYTYNVNATDPPKRPHNFFAPPLPRGHVHQSPDRPYPVDC